jgi:hypothetical protein
MLDVARSHWSVSIYIMSYLREVARHTGPSTHWRADKSLADLVIFS